MTLAPTPPVSPAQKTILITTVFAKKPDHIFKIVQYSLEWACILSARLNTLDPIKNSIDICKILTNLSKINVNIYTLLAATKNISIEQLKPILSSLKTIYAPIVKIFTVLQKYNIFNISEIYLLRANMLAQGFLLYSTITSLTDEFYHPFVATELAQNLADLTITTVTIASLITGSPILPTYILLALATAKLVMSINDDMHKTQTLPPKKSKLKLDPKCKLHTHNMHFRNNHTKHAHNRFNKLFSKHLHIARFNGHTCRLHKRYASLLDHQDKCLDLKHLSLPSQ
jgi:hypothetical protein